MPLNATYTLGPFAVAGDGRLSVREPDATPAFTFRWRDRVARASLVASDESSGRLTLQAALGRVPSTADQAALRSLSFATLRGLPVALPEGWSLRLLPDHSILLEAEADLALPVTASSLLAEVTRFLLTLAPYLDLLDEGGLSPRPATAAGLPTAGPPTDSNAGTAKTCPG